MTQFSRNFTTFTIAIVGLVTTPITATSLTLQQGNQSVSIIGNNNKAEQEVNQILLKSFTINFDLITQDLNEIDETLQQDAEQEAFIVGNRNRVIQDINQVLVNLFYVSGKSSELEENQDKSNQLIPQLNNIASSYTPLIIEQLTFQDLLIDGQENQVRQQISQTAISFFWFDLNLYSPQWITELVNQDNFYLDLWVGDLNRVTQQVNQTWLELFFFGSNFNTDSLNLDGLIDPALNPIILSSLESLALEKNFFDSYREQNFSRTEFSASVPESSCVISLLGLGIIGIFSKISQFYQEN